MATRLGLIDLFRAAPRSIGRYTGTLLAVFVVQTIVTLAVMMGVAIVLAQAFGKLPIFDDAVDGDLVSLIWCLRFGKANFLAVIGIVLGGVLLWQLASWFLVGGLYGVLANRPEGRRETARCFGASGTTTYLAYARLALCSIPGWFVVLSVFAQSLLLVEKRLEYALTIPQLAGALAIAFLPALLVLHVLWTISDYARVELTLRGESHEPSVVMTYLRTAMYVLKRPATLAHAGIGWLAFVLVTVIYAYIAQGHPMYGAEGAIALFVIREGVALARTAIRFGVLAGQIELGKTRALPPMHVKVDAKKSG
ncbi:MAG TPA: hypothetical protein VMZ53_16145 [Kofleriaceae bacterium]|nr:hypothetical protein [Kofleriaceae bacterium]